MKAARLYEYTDDPSTAFTIEEVSDPEIERSNDVIVDVRAAGWCHTDNHIIEGGFADVSDVDLPYTPGHETAGIVAEAGADVTTVDVGDEVVVHPPITCGTCRACRSGEDMYCPNRTFSGIDADGGFAEYLHTSERSLVSLDSLDPVEAAPHADAGLTAYRAAKKAASDLVPGDYALVVGIGGLGHIGLQVLQSLTPATIIAADVREAALGLAADLGADYTVDSSEHDLASEVDDLTDGTGVGAVLDFVGSDVTLRSGPGLLAPGGDHHIVGYEGGLSIPAQALVGREIDFRATLVGTYTELQELIELAEQGHVDVLTSTYDLDEINEIARRLHAGEISGRAVFTP